MKNSFKIMLMMVAFFASTSSVNAQFSNKESNRVPDRFHMGVRGGMTINSYTKDLKDAKSAIFPTGGIALDFKVAPFPLYVGTAVNYVNYAYKLDTKYVNDKKWDIHAIQVPIIVSYHSYHINVAPNLFVNPFVGEFMAVAVSKEGGIDKSFNYGLRAGCGLNFGKLTFDVGYDLGLANLGKGSFETRTGTFFMTLGYNWLGSR